MKYQIQAELQTCTASQAKQGKPYQYDITREHQGPTRKDQLQPMTRKPYLIWHRNLNAWKNWNLNFM